MAGRILVLAIAVLAMGCDGRQRLYDDARTLTGGEPERGVDAIGRYGCGSCHTVPGIRGANGTVGPSLEGIANRTYLAGRLPNSPSNMAQWIQQPQHVEPGTAMPNMGISDAEARDITAYLYTLR